MKKLDFSKSSKSDRAYASLIRLLYKRDHSEKELRDKLNRWYTPEAVEAAVALAHEREYIKDPEFLSRQFGEALHRRGKGLFYVNQTLKKKGLPPVALDRDRELAKCQELLARKFKTEELKQTPVRVKAYRYLTARGFDSETINKALKNPLTESDLDL